MSAPTELRPARPTREEGLAFEHFLDQASEGLVRVLMGRKTDEILARAFAEPGHDLSFEHVTFAERGGRLVGMSSGFTAEQHRRSDSRPLRAAAGLRGIRMLLLGVLGWPFFRFTLAVPDGDFYLQALAVDPDERGEGLGSRLLDHVEGRALAAGARRLCLDVAIQNEGGRRLYARRGMVEEGTSPPLFFDGDARVVRMAKVLGGRTG